MNVCKHNNHQHRLSISFLALVYQNFMFQQMLKVKKYMYYDSVILKNVLN